MFVDQAWISLARINRDALFAKLALNSIAILPGNVTKFRSNDTQYPFRQNSDFYYLTAFSEPDALAVFIKGKKERSQQFILFCQAPDPLNTIWHGEQFGPEAAVKVFGADLAYPNNLITKILPELFLDKEILYYPNLTNPQKPKQDHALYYEHWAVLKKVVAKPKNIDNHKSQPNFPKIIKELSGIIHELRLIKSNLELAKIRYVTQITADAHQHIIQYVAKHKDLTERQIQAEFVRFCIYYGCEDLAYPSIVAAGENACILHYTQNSKPLKNGELILVDAGGEYQYYAADLTRTFPVNGKFSASQKELYQLVLAAQTQAIALVKPGTRWEQLQQTIVKVLVAGLLELKILPATIDLPGHIAQGSYKQFYMHGSGHFLGLDVHDVGKGAGQVLMPGMVLTIEPGLYFRQNPKLDPKWHGIGIRIEDDLLVTANGHEILTRSAVKEIADLEHLMLN